MASLARKRSRPPSPTASARKPYYVVLAVLIGVTALVLAVRLEGGDGPVPATGDCPLTPVAGFADVHGLALDPERPDEIRVATHHGLFRGDASGAFVRVGRSEDDLMGFTAHPTNASTVWSSGHPRGGGNLGFRVSADGGCTWERIALPGVDLHAITVSPVDPDRLWGYSVKRLYRTADGGHDWDLASETPPIIVGVAADRSDPDGVFAATFTQGVLRSTDGGRTWTGFWNGTTAYAVALDVARPSVAYARTKAGSRGPRTTAPRGRTCRGLQGSRSCPTSPSTRGGTAWCGRRPSTAACRAAATMADPGKRSFRPRNPLEGDG